MPTLARLTTTAPEPLTTPARAYNPTPHPAVPLLSLNTAAAVAAAARYGKLSWAALTTPAPDIFTTPTTSASAYNASPASAVPLLSLNSSAPIDAARSQNAGQGENCKYAWDSVRLNDDITFASTGKPERRHWLIMISLSLISFVVSLDATILVTALPVSFERNAL